MNRIRRIALTVAVVGGMTGGSLALLAPSAGAAPITCPGGQSATKTSSGWVCQNNGGNPTGAGHHKGTGDKI
jgi:hypothetical protein